MFPSIQIPDPSGTLARLPPGTSEAAPGARGGRVCSASLSESREPGYIYPAKVSLLYNVRIKRDSLQRMIPPIDGAGYPGDAGTRLKRIAAEIGAYR